jgi:hypothetical protein
MLETAQNPVSRMGVTTLVGCNARSVLEGAGGRIDLVVMGADREPGSRGASVTWQSTQETVGQRV